MLLIIGTKNCSRCNMTKAILNNKNVEYTYKLNNEISKNELNEYLNKARSAGLMSFPLIIKDDEIIKLEDVVK
jgi:glutaredoxin